MSATAHKQEIVVRPPALWRRAGLVLAVALFALLWAGGVAGQWLGRARGDEGAFASLFLFLAALVVLLGARTRRDALRLASVALLGFAVEAVGAHTGLPFGEYDYTDVLRPQFVGVPVVMGCAWMALVAFACELAARLRLGAWPTVILAALWTTAIDLVIDPLAANHFGYWTWAERGAYYGIPFVNFVGWFLTALVGCRLLTPPPRTNLWAVFVGVAILLFFAAVALAHALLPVALVGLALAAIALFVATRFRAR